MSDFKSIIDKFDDEASVRIPNAVSIRIPKAEDWLKSGLEYFVKALSHGTVPKAVWNEANYRPVANWMADNQGRGLLMIGGCGLGKTLIGKYILPYLIRYACGKILNVFNAQDLNARPDEIMRYRLVYVDDIGTEGISNVYGNKRMPFMELCDAAEQEGKLLVCSTNLTTGELAEKYGERTIDRLKATTKVVPFTGKSLRK